MTKSFNNRLEFVSGEGDRIHPGWGISLLFIFSIFFETSTWSLRSFTADWVVCILGFVQSCAEHARIPFVSVTGIEVESWTCLDGPSEEYRPWSRAPGMHNVSPKEMERASQDRGSG